MLRKITVDIGRFKVGTPHDFPRGVWCKIAADLFKGSPKHEAFAELPKGAAAEAILDTFSRAEEFNPAQQSLTRGNPNLRNRPGSNARQPTR